MKIWFDTEFIEDGRTIDLISIGMVREDGKTYYAESADCDFSRASGWVAKNVIPHLDYTKEGPGYGHRKPRWRIANDIVEFVGHHPEFWAYYADYDWVALCQLYGRMIDLPDTWPMFCCDVQQLHYQHPTRSGYDLPDIKGQLHNALADARWCKDAYEYLTP